MHHRKRDWGGPPLAWLNLIHVKGRLIVAISAICFTVALIFMQLGLFSAVLKSATLIYDNLNFDIVLISSKSLEATFTQPFSRQRLYQAQGIKGVASAMPFYTSFFAWRNPQTHQTRQILVLGFNLRDQVLKIPEVYEYITALQRQDTVLMSRLSRNDFGSQTVGLKTELADRKIQIVGSFSISNSLRADGSVIMNDQNFIRFSTGRSLDDVSLGLITVEPNTNINTVISNLRQLLPKNIEVKSRSEAENRDQKYFILSTFTGLVLSISAVAAFVVGIVIIFQILNVDVTEHLHEYATLKAIGYTNYYLSLVVLKQAVLMSSIGFIPALFIASLLYKIIYEVTKLPIYLTLDKVIFVFFSSLIMCCLSGIIALRKVLVEDPASIF
ncbi:MAG: ABC transporter permease DevC [Nostoc indistinguendum CM1-VF10]|nr:ABC transporter permease DevC [Nostoc indistinguendum CM1-VF10]